MRALSITGLVLSFVALWAGWEASARPGPEGIQWPSFRGPGASGIAEGHKTPLRWSAVDGTNIRWKTAIPGLGHSSPVVWDNRVFVATAVSATEKPTLRVGLYGDIKPVEEDGVQHWKVFCFDKSSGKILWERTAHSGVPKIKRHPKSTHASQTVATDGKYLIAFFGSEGLYCYDLNGNLKWKKDLGVLDSSFFMVPSAQWGSASSPVIFDNMVIVQCDVRKDSFVASFRLEDGREIWRTERDEIPTWSTPTVHVFDGQAQVLLNGFKHIGAYDARTGKEIWRLKGGGDIPVPTPLVAHDMVFITNAHGSSAPIFAIRAAATGDISLPEGATSNEHIAWSHAREGSYMQTPLVYGDLLYNCRDNGVLSCYEARTGVRKYQTRLADGRTGFSASAVAGDGKVYYTSEDGDVYVVKAGPEFELLATNPMGEVCMATPAISEGAMFFRTQHQLVCVAPPRR